MWPGTVVLKVMEGISCQQESCLVKIDGHPARMRRRFPGLECSRKPTKNMG
jgi:hypothetical protein